MSTEKNLNNLVINKVESQDVYNYMKANSLINADELYFVEGDNEISIEEATETESGLMSAADKVKLNGIEEGANNYTHPSYTARNVGLYKITVDTTGHISDAVKVIKDDITSLGIPAQDTTYSEATTTSAGLMSATDKARLDGLVATGGEANQNAFSNVAVGAVTVEADNTTDTLTFEAGDNVVIVADAVNDKITISAVDTTYGEAGTSLGLVKSGGDVTIASGIITVNDDSHNHTIANVDNLQSTLDSKVDKVDGKGLSTNDLTATLKSNYDTAYAHSQQVHAPADAEKNVIVGIQKNGTDLTVNSSTRKVNITVPTKTSDLTNDSNFATTTDLEAKVDKVTGMGLSTNDYTTEEKTKLANIEDGANKTVVDTALSSTSTNPVQNKVINTKLDSMQADIDSKVPSSRTVNGKALTANITLSASDVGALPDTTIIPSIDGLATETYVDNKVAGLVDSAPAALDTLNELAAALGDDPNFATTVATQIGTKVDKVEGKGLSTNDYTTDEKVKLSGIEEGAQANQNAFSNVMIGGTIVSADNATDTVTLTAGDNVTLIPDSENNKITISSTDTIYTHPVYTSRTNGLYKVTVDNTGHISDAALAEKADIVELGIPAQDTTYSIASNTQDGLMSASDKGKFDGMNISAGSVVRPVYFNNGVPTVIDELDSVAFDGYVTKGAESGSTIGASATVEGVNNMASSKQSHAEGGYTRAGNLTLYSESTGMFDSYGYEHAEGYSTLAKKCAAHAEGAHTQAIALMAHAEGLSTIASGGKSHAEGHSTTASGANAHTEGYSTTASGENTHAEGNSTTASFQAAHAEGYGTTASGYAAHAEGYSTIASGTRSHTEGFYTKASSENQHVQGKYNIEDTADTYAHIVGNGTSDTARSNAHTLDWNGNAWFAGDVYVGGTGQKNGTKLATVPTVTSITLTAANWTGSANPYSQVVTISAATANSKIDLQPTAAQIVDLQNQEIQLMVENDAGTCTCYAIGGKPTSDMTMDVLITEVNRV